MENAQRRELLQLDLEPCPAFFREDDHVLSPGPQQLSPGLHPVPGPAASCGQNRKESNVP